MLLLALLLPVAAVAWLRMAWMPGWADLDEAGQIVRLQLLREGWPLPWRQGGGSLHLHLQAAFLSVTTWRVENLLSLGLCLYLAESLLLYRVAKAWAGSRAAVWALAVNAFSALSFTRLGSLLWFQVLTMQWLALAALLPWARGPWRAAIWGALAGLFLLDYDGWVLALPGLALLFAHSHGRRLALWGALGFGLAAAAVAWQSRDWFAASLAVRQVQTLPHSLLQALATGWRHSIELVFGGGRALLYLGVPLHPQIAPWAWVGLLASWPLWRQRWPWVLAALPPLAAIFLRSPAIEPMRCLAAWPLFCLFAGAGFASLKPRRWAVVLPLLAMLGAAWELYAYRRGFELMGARFYGASWNELKAGRALRESGQGLLSELDPRGAALRFATGLPPEALARKPALALIPWQDQPDQSGAQGTWTVLQSLPKEPPLLLLAPAPSAAADLQTADEALAELWPYYHLEPLDRFLLRVERACESPLPDPRLRTALWEARFKVSRWLGRPLEDEARLARSHTLLRVDPLIREARRNLQAQPARALALMEEATRRDPRRMEAWVLRHDALRALGRDAEAAGLAAQAKRMNGGTPLLLPSVFVDQTL